MFGDMRNLSPQDPIGLSRYDRTAAGTNPLDPPQNRRFRPEGTGEMTDDILPPRRFLRTQEAPRSLELSGRALEKHKSCGTEAVYRKFGGRVVIHTGMRLRCASSALRLLPQT
jgi:hypothetical protein